MRSSIKKYVYECRHELQNNSRLSLLAKEQILEEFQIWAQIEFRIQCPYKFKNFGHSVQNIRKS